jgi:hypothetical protein
MKIENQVCKLGQAKRLKELGVIQDAIWFWVYPENEKMISSTFGVYHHLQARDIVGDNEGDQFDDDLAAAFTVAELGAMLPLGYHTHTRDFDHEDWLCYDDDGDDFSTLHSFKTEAEARAAMLIHLLENKLVTPEEINNRLNS